MKLPAVILSASRQKEKVDRLVKYCKDLDGTEIRVLELPPDIDHTPHPIGVELAVRWAAKQINEPWLYLEADSIPLIPGWLSAVTEEYIKAGKPFMLPSLEGLSSYDVASAIGVWPANTADLLGPAPNKPPYFDLIIYKYFQEQLHLTKSIQHSYGLYDGCRVIRRWEFPRDKSIVRPEAVIFHADPTQSIVRGGLAQSFYHSGDFGDIIAALPIIKQQGGGRLVVGPHHTYRHYKNPREQMTRERFELIRPLLETQPYVRRVEFAPKFNEGDIDRDLSTFRFHEWNGTDNLAQWQGRHLGRLELDLSPWLAVEAPWTGRVVCSRSLRYHNAAFPWKQIAEKYGDRIIFIGLPDEHKAFCSLVGRSCERAITNNLLDMATVVAGAELQFSNQSSPWWIAAGLGKRVIQETWGGEVNSIIDRDGLTYTRNAEEIQQLHNLLNEPTTIPNPETACTETS